MKKTIESFNGWKVVRGAKDVASFVKFTIGKSSKDKKTGNWTNMYIDVMCGDKLARHAQRTAIEGTLVYVKGNLKLSEYKGKTQYTLFAEELEPVSEDMPAVDQAVKTAIKGEDDLPW